MKASDYIREEGWDGAFETFQDQVLKGVNIKSDSFLSDLRDHFEALVTIDKFSSIQEAEHSLGCLNFGLTTKTWVGKMYESQESYAKSLEKSINLMKGVASVEEICILNKIKLKEILKCQNINT